MYSAIVVVVNLCAHTGILYFIADSEKNNNMHSNSNRNRELKGKVQILTGNAQQQLLVKNEKATTKRHAEGIHTHASYIVHIVKQPGTSVRAPQETRNVPTANQCNRPLLHRQQVARAHTTSHYSVVVGTIFFLFFSN